MELKNQVCSLELAKRLKELGVRQESLWVCKESHEGWKIKDNDFHVGLAISGHANVVASAYTVAELGEMLRDNVSSISIEKDKLNKWSVEVLPEFGDWTREYDNSLANLLAKMLIYLLENNLLSSTKEGV